MNPARPPYVFLSYRRGDSAQAVLGLYFQLRLRFGSNRVFMDVAMTPGTVWPERLQRALERATLVLAVLGPRWLTAADDYGRRRLDQDEDWVRRELATALDAGTPVIPLRVGGLDKLPPPEALPPPLVGLLRHQGYALRDDHWEDDIQSLARWLSAEHGFQEVDASVIYPEKRVDVRPLTTQELDQALLQLPGWEPVESMIPRDHPRSRQELRRAYRFESYADAACFMQALVAPLERLNHHPRLENQWRTVIVNFSTWDIGHRITALDVESARATDAVYASLQALPSRQPAT